MMKIRRVTAFLLAFMMVISLIPQSSLNAKENTENASMIEQMKMKVLGCYDESAKPNMGKLKIDLESMGANVIGDKFPVTATISEKNIQ